jgi:hypothetical protein
VEPQAVTKTVEAQRAKAKAKVVADVPWARCGDLLVGIGLQASVFLWPRSDESRVSAWLPGLLISIIALLSMGAPPMRWLNAFVAMWLILWTMAATTTEPLAYAIGIVSGLLVLILSAIPTKSAATDFRD